MATESTIIVFAILAALGLVGIAVVEAVFILPQDVDAKGCKGGFTGFNASLGRCFRG